MKKITEIRKDIDEIDKKLLELINDRAKKALDIRKLKIDNNIALYDPKREEEIIDNLCKINKGPLYDNDVRELFSNLMSKMKELPNE